MARQRNAGPRTFDCRRTSFLQLCEQLIPNAHSRRPLQRVCSIMRRRRAQWAALHRGLEREPYFQQCYPAVRRELEHHRVGGRGDCEAVQLSFFSSCPQAELKAALRSGRVRGGRVRLLGTCVLIRPPDPRTPATPATPPESAVRDPASAALEPYILEALITTPEVATVASPRQPKQPGRRGSRSRPVVAPSDDGVSSHVHVFSDAEVFVAGTRFRIDASYYCQQNAVTSSCAHCCLRSALWTLGLGGESGQRDQVSTETLNAVVARAVARRGQASFDPRDGLTRDDIETVCEAFGAEVLRVEYDDSPQPYFAHSPYEMAYMLVESGFPTLLLFKTRDGPTGQEARHVVPVVGHTFNSDAWLLAALRRYDHLPQTTLVTSLRHKQYLSTVEWAPQLILHDDLLGPYYNVGPDVLTRPVDPRDSGIGRVGTVMAVVPKGLGWAKSPALAQQVARSLFNTVWDLHARTLSAEWRDRLKERWTASDGLRMKELILRTQLVRKSDYLGHLQRHPDHTGRRANVSSSGLRALRAALDREPTDCVWLVEVTIPEIFTANVAKVGEIVLPLQHADRRTAADLLSTPKHRPYASPPLLSRLLGGIIAYDAEAFITRVPVGFASHTPLFVRGIDAVGGW